MAPHDKIHLYADRPEMGDDLKFAHKVLAAWLQKLIEEVQAPFRLAITGKLGSGKSTVVHNALLYFETKKSEYAVAYVDVWKLDQTSARRSTILRVAKDFGINLETDQFKKLHRSMYGSVNTVDDITQSNSLAKGVPFFRQMIFWYILLLGIGVALTSYYLISTYSAALTSEQVPDWLKITLSAIVTASVTVSNVIAQKILQVKSSVNQAPFVGPEEFEDAFQMILDDPILANKKAIVVFDNIDRAPKAKIEEILTGISAFFDHSSGKTFRNIIILVPFSPISNKELDVSTIQKFFDAVIPLPSLMPEDLIEFTRTKLTGAGWETDADEIAQLVDRSDLKTPREILHFINELIAQISLANSLESLKYRNEEGVESTYLAKGSLTNSKVFYAKLKLCERITPDFIWDALTEYKSAEEVFDINNYTGGSEGSEQRKLYDFLRATEGIPEKLPESIEQFIYFKGSDLELSIPGSAALRESMNNRSSEEVRAFFDKSQDLDPIEKLFANNFSRNKNNSLRRKNSILSILEAFDQIPSESMRKELARACSKLKESIYDLPISQLVKITPYSSSEIENIGVWKQLDNVYKELKKEINGTEKEIEAWRIEYLKHVLKQPNGLERAGISSNDFKAQYFEDPELFKEIKVAGLHKFVGSVNLPTILDFVENKSFDLADNSLSNLGEAINAGIENCGSNLTSRIQMHFTKISEHLIAKISKPAQLNLLIAKLHKYLIQLNSTKTTEKMWTTIAQVLETQTSNLNNVANSDGAIDLVAFLLLINKRAAFSNRPNLQSFIKNYMRKANTIEPLISLSEKFGSWAWVDSLNKILPGELELLVKKPALTVPFAKYADHEGANYLVNNITALVLLDSFNELFAVIPDNSNEKLSKDDVINAFYTSPSCFPMEKAKIIFDYLLQSDRTIDSSFATKVVVHFLEQSKDEHSASYLLTWCEGKGLNIINIVNALKDSLEDEGNTSWSEDSSLKFFIVVKGSSTRPSDFYTTLFNKAIERGIFSGTSNATVKRVASVLEHVWRLKIGATANLLRDYRNAIEKSIRLDENERNAFLVNLEVIAKQNQLSKELGYDKPSITEKLSDKIAEIVKGKSSE